MTTYRFMTGATVYRLNARSEDEALQIAIAELNPGDDTRAIIISTLRDESQDSVYQNDVTKPILKPV